MKNKSKCFLLTAIMISCTFTLYPSPKSLAYHFNNTMRKLTMMEGGHASIMFYRKWLLAPNSIQNETIVHEYGHAVGLGHTQKANNSISVMREYDFNGKAYPLADDRAGIAALY